MEEYMPPETIFFHRTATAQVYGTYINMWIQNPNQENNSTTLFSLFTSQKTKKIMNLSPIEQILDKNKPEWRELTLTIHQPLNMIVLPTQIYVPTQWRLLLVNHVQTTMSHNHVPQ